MTEPHRLLTFLMGAVSANCLQYFLVFRQFFPDAKLYYNADHVLCMLNGKFYDRDGEQDGEGFLHWKEYSKTHFVKNFALSKKERVQLSKYFKEDC